MEIELKNPDIRKIKDIENVLLDERTAKANPEQELYYMYRGIKEENDLRYDITVIPPFLMGDEFVKTKGHFHSSGHAEMYIVLEGEAIFLMQKGTDEVKDIYAVKAAKDDIVIIDKEYGHITINPSAKETLKLANWVSIECCSDYKSIEDKRGAAYFYTIKGWVKNNNYKDVPEIRFEEPLKETPKNLNFLK
ncbi:glucose-6-phosphate isomerase [bacterium]|jgi:glucose-6-phosphate isomerase|nr:glucose-6-phosphate isomerase [bacterium]